MSFSSIRSQLVTVLGAVSGIGNVWDYRRHMVYWETFYRDAVKNMEVNNWEISRSENIATIDAVQNSLGSLPYFRYNHHIVIYGHMGVNDDNASEKTFQNLVDGVMDGLRTNVLLTGLIVPMDFTAPKIEYAMWGGVFVHATEIHILAQERVGG
jgi:hypothetical protein